jgi:hypothetical protein
MLCLKILRYVYINFDSISPFLERYNWNIVESGVKHHKPNPPFFFRCEPNNITYSYDFMKKKMEIRK